MSWWRKDDGDADEDGGGENVEGEEEEDEDYKDKEDRCCNSLNFPQFSKIESIDC